MNATTGSSSSSFLSRDLADCKANDTYKMAIGKSEELLTQRILTEIAAGATSFTCTKNTKTGEWTVTVAPRSNQELMQSVLDLKMAVQLDILAQAEPEDKILGPSLYKKYSDISLLEAEKRRFSKQVTALEKAAADRGNSATKSKILIETEDRLKEVLEKLSKALIADSLEIQQTLEKAAVIKQESAQKVNNMFDNLDPVLRDSNELRDFKAMAPAIKAAQIEALIGRLKIS